MAIRPKIGETVGFTGWYVINGKESPETPWTGRVIKIFGEHKRYYHIKRDYDGEVFTTTSRSLYRIQQEGGGAE